jgi:hypothetical protein
MIEDRDAGEPLMFEFEQGDVRWMYDRSLALIG